ncbi:fructosamine kinase family protein [Halotalea alkalilenta]|uniref:fructosamine kinase family protein n=1 Tax=Halotalea alkalilenta TaxID=376489 RepID=UPI001B80DE3A|nr:fructosamine kinase family protein [Halotalea alkalilenta]
MPYAMTPFIKSAAGAPPTLFATEAAGLDWLAAAGGAEVVEVLDVAPDRLSLARLDTSDATAASAEAFGRALLVTHRAGAPAFGAPPPQAPGPHGFIGPTGAPLPMRYGDWPEWGAFFAEARITPYLRLAQDAGAIDQAGSETIERLSSRLAAGEFDDGEAPSRLHGDLWSGNLLWCRQGCVMIDPAAHGGHFLDDLAMLALFGAPMLERIHGAYAEAAGLDAGWRQRLALHQLYPLLVHAVLFGGGYAARAVKIAKRFG